MRANKFSPFILAIFSGGLLALSFPHPDFYLLAWMAFIPLFFAIQDQRPCRAFLTGWISGLVYFTGTLSWVTISMNRYGSLPWVASFLVMLLLVAYLALYVGLFTALMQYLSSDRKKNLLLFSPVLWVLLEFIKGRFLSGFPWASLAYSQHRILSIIQIADFGSIYSLGFVIVLFNRALYLTIRQIGFQRPTRDWKPLLIGLSILLLSLIYGKFRLSEPVNDQEVIVSVIQGNIPQDQKWDQTFQDQTMETYMRLSLSSLDNTILPKPSFILWPEAAVPFIFETESTDAKALRNFARDENVNLLFGAPSIKSEQSGMMALRNSAFLISPDNTPISHYDKMHLVPFGEYIPFSRLLFFVNKLVEGVGDFTSGEVPVVFEAGEVKVGTVICFEVIFPELVRRFVNNGANLMTTITNDAWFDQSAASEQHFSMVVFRAIENRRPFARAANTGISGFVDAYGRVIHQTDLFVEATATASLRLGNRKTLYTRFGDFFAVLCGIMTLGMIFNRRRKKNAV